MAAFQNDRYNSKSLENVDLEFAIRNRKILTPIEFKLTFPNENYEEYTKLYYEEKLHRFFDRYSSEKWFNEKSDSGMSSKQKILDNYEEFEHLNREILPVLNINQVINTRLKNNDGHYLIFKNLPPNYGIRDIIELLSRFEEIKDFSIAKTSFNQSYDRRVFLTLEQNTDKTDIIEKLRLQTLDRIEIEYFEITHKIITKSSWIDQKPSDLENLRRILEILNKQYRTDIKFESDNIDHFIIFLRYVFNYCYYCTKLYDSDIEMFYDCGDYHLRDNKVQTTIFDRKQRVLTMEKDFSFAQNQTLEKELEYHVTRESANIFSCTQCHRNFENTKNVVEHIKIQHEAFARQIGRCLESFKKFVTQIDINLLIHLDGIDNNFLPSFSVHESEGSAVKYDLPLIYSGNLKFKK
ncbi:C2H2 Zn-finger protein [Pseudoloma neurophilia]|uniref:C2H2 Zn-finger protein n=1 Tax=Pseudoloma neurophilia TaxID=146866 RepID=A0A0R0LYL5_9MICR|nr:C2H2 Zn-finger protein [Pseudoloma neurophilia]